MWIKTEERELVKQSNLPFEQSLNPLLSFLLKATKLDCVWLERSVSLVLLQVQVTDNPSTCVEILDATSDNKETSSSIMF